LTGPRDKVFRGQRSYQSGMSAEDQVARHYEDRGYSVAERRWMGGAGEIDLILRHGQTLVFVEVKKSRSLAMAAARVSQTQMQRIYASAGQFLDGEPAGQLTETRFDVALVDGAGQIEVIENAFGLN